MRTPTTSATRLPATMAEARPARQSPSSYSSGPRWTRKPRLSPRQMQTATTSQTPAQATTKTHSAPSTRCTSARPPTRSRFRSQIPTARRRRCAGGLISTATAYLRPVKLPASPYQTAALAARSHGPSPRPSPSARASCACAFQTTPSRTTAQPAWTNAASASEMSVKSRTMPSLLTAHRCAARSIATTTITA